jgi:putative flippase GtrA
MRLRDAFGASSLLRFLLAGGVAALVNVLSRLLYSQAVSYTVAVVAAYVTGMATAYVLNRLLVFGPGDRGVPGEMLAFVMVNLLAVAQTLVISLGLAYYVLPALGVVQHAETLAHVVGVVVPVFTSFVGHKYWTFRNHPR